MGREELTIGQLSPVPRVFLVMIDGLDMMCEFAEQGCQEKFKYEHHNAHRQICDFDPNRMFNCENGCGMSIPWSSRDEHSCVQHLLSALQKSQASEAAAQTELNRKTWSEIGYRQQIRDLSNQLAEMRSNIQMIRVPSAHVDTVNKLRSNAIFSTDEVYNVMSSIDLKPYYSNRNPYDFR